MLSGKGRVGLAVLVILVLVEFSLIVSPSWAVQFADIQGHWAEQDLTRVAALDWLKGTPSGESLPDKEVSLLESVVLFLKAGGYDLEDVPAGPQVPWGQQYIDTALSKEIIPEELLSEFDPLTPVKRRHVAFMLCNLLQLPLPDEVTVTSTFSDLKGVEEELPCIEAVVRAGLMRGTGEGRFAPESHIKRGEMAVLLSQLIDKHWARLPEGRRLEGWLRPVSKAKSKSQSQQNLELVSLTGVQKLKLSPDVTCFAENRKCTLQDVLQHRVEIILDSKKRVTWISVLEKRTGGLQDEKMRGSVKNVALGEDNFLVLTDLSCQDHTLPLAWNAILEDSKGRNCGFQTLKNGNFVDLYLTDDKVSKVVILETKKNSGTVQSLTDRRLNLQSKGSRKNTPGWFNYYDWARIVDKDGRPLSTVLRGDRVQITYLDPVPEEIDDEIPLEIVITKRPEPRTVKGTVQDVRSGSGDYLLILKKDKRYTVDRSAAVKLLGGESGSFSDLLNGQKVELQVDGAGVVTEIKIVG
jgi:hypothetical protein